ncbi:MAG TPA: glycosyltransferase, partial [Puia sp.]|nr:glycosyltransferase [Puia sp.]
QKIREWKPDVLWVFKGMELSPEILKWAREEKVFLMNYNPDNPFLFSGRGSGNRNVAESIGLYDLHLTYDGSVKERIGREYGITCLSLPFGFELSDAVWEKCRAQEEVKKLCFVGNPDKQRAAFIRELADDFALDIYGHGWSNFIRHHNVTICPPVYDEEFWKALYRYRGQLNLMRLHNPDSHNMRSFEVPGVGGIGLFPRTGDHTQFFEEGREVFLYGDMKECRKWAGNLLSMTDSQAGEIRRAARRRSLESKYSYRDRSFQVTAIIKEFCL